MGIRDRERKLLFALILVCLIFAPVRSAAGQGSKPILLAVDATSAPQRIFHAKLTIPVSPGPLTLVYPKWLPGEHGPTGPITDLAGLKMSWAGGPVSWSRDLADMYAFHCEAPPGADTLEVDLDFLSPTSLGGFSSSASATSKLAVFNWNQLLLYPAGAPSSQVKFALSLKLPPSWKYATALAVDKEISDVIQFKPVSLETLVDSPLIAGLYMRAQSLTFGDQVPIELDIVADSAAAMKMDEAVQNHFVRLADEALALFGGYHFNEYRFLLTLSDHVASFGLEHHESSDNRVPERTLLDPRLRLVNADLLPHEFVHSWNGKYRRPMDLTTPNYQEPMKTDLLWVYEGLTQYLGRVLGARSGLMTPSDTREVFAWTAASLDHTPGRTWRPLIDTAVSAQLLYNAPKAWSSWRRGVDFYDESALIWLEADTIIRRQTQGAKSLDDFCRRFHGGVTGPQVRTYTLDDVLDGLFAIAPYDWRTFFTDRIYKLNLRAPLGGIEASGWKLEYSDRKNEYVAATEATEGIVDLNYSIGLKINAEVSSPGYGTAIDVIPGMAAAKAGIAPGMKLISVNGRQWSAELLHAGLAAARGTTDRFDLLMSNGEFLKSYPIDYHEGDKYPHLRRDPSKEDLMGEILNSKVARK